MVKTNLTCAQYIVFAEEIYESAVNDNAEDFPKVAVDSYPSVVIGVKCFYTFKDWGNQSLVTNIGEDARAEDDVNEFKYSQSEFVVCIFYPKGLSGLEGCYFVL